jgi:hypothetical protein
MIMARKTIWRLSISAMWGVLLLWSQGRILLPALLALPGAIAAFRWQQRRNRSGFCGAVFASCLAVEILVCLEVARESLMRQYLVFLLLDGLIVGVFVGLTVAIILHKRLWSAGVYEE